MGFPGGAVVKKSSCQCRRSKRRRFDPWVRKIPWRRKWQPTPVFLPRKFHGQRSLVGYSPWSCKESDTIEVTKHKILRDFRKKEKLCRRVKKRGVTTECDVQKV